MIRLFCYCIAWQLGISKKLINRKYWIKVICIQNETWRRLIHRRLMGIHCVCQQHYWPMIRATVFDPCSRWFRLSLVDWSQHLWVSRDAEILVRYGLKRVPSPVTPMEVVKTRVQTQAQTKARYRPVVSKLCYVFHNGLMTHVCKPNSTDCLTKSAAADATSMRPLRGAMVGSPYTIPFIWTFLYLSLFHNHQYQSQHLASLSLSLSFCISFFCSFSLPFRMPLSRSFAVTVSSACGRDWVPRWSQHCRPPLSTFLPTSTWNIIFRASIIFGILSTASPATIAAKGRL